ncbi:hypothetical protein [Aurantimonas sp. 22II-16-19i]|uniref:hypothetical protein n=1 Tax=Aurantimonas sp. 22II-16-19i TaxID=1317114 RepID=UPI0009F7FDF4|nr:hypothetical protein [Aurantimonas sp. 22II-16-19i]ORE98915.1 transmembrane prediction [Aurantimonas sp. 22II-16-19i]
MAIGNKTRDNLWTLITTPTIWAVHFVLSYGSVAYGCAPNEDIFQGIGGYRIFVGGLTVVALGAIGFVFLRALGEWRRNGGRIPHEEDSAEVRERFLEFSTVLLAGLSFVAVLYTALPAAMMVDCR